MKQYKIIGGRSLTSISDGTSFVITTSMKKYSECTTGFSVNLHCGGEMYWLFTMPPDYFSTYSDTTREMKSVKWKPKGSKKDMNLVVRVDKFTEGDNPAFTTYINGEYLATTKSRRPTTAGLKIIQIKPVGLPVTLTIFNDAELGNVEEFVQEMRNSEKTYFDLNADGSEGATRADGGPSSIPGTVTGLRSQDSKLMDSVDVNGDGSEDVIATYDGLSSTPPTGIRSRDPDFTEYSNPNGDGSEGISNIHDKHEGPSSSAGTEAHPPDANLVNQSSTLAWKKVVNNVLGLSRRMGSAFSLKERNPQPYQRQGTDDGSDMATGPILNSDGGIQPTREL
ncbi:hypothetical protein GALMADRAFT_159022 [Galerina marginata CBS 339.88]|uniref:Uncharacterized protein n=1 Tax=Galerina marginata (strain CBS 339.88) TaxID=685588 RepID=A0A067SN21_GALM3|nr:hypothetical protein GALMADRAFT_159022 [Galerina marginata CBS 339.88]